jgi:hypothetical protein
MQMPCHVPRSPCAACRAGTRGASLRIRRVFRGNERGARGRRTWFRAHFVRPTPLECSFPTVQSVHCLCSAAATCASAFWRVSRRRAWRSPLELVEQVRSTARARAAASEALRLALILHDFPSDFPDQLAWRRYKPEAPLLLRWPTQSRFPYLRAPRALPRPGREWRWECSLWAPRPP